MSDKEKATFKPFTVKHLLEKDEKQGQENNLVKTSTLQQEKDDMKIASQTTTIFTALPKNTCNSQALNLAERLAGDYILVFNIFCGADANLSSLNISVNVMNYPSFEILSTMLKKHLNKFSQLFQYNNATVFYNYQNHIRYCCLLK